jgi:hypothetical protein
MGFPSFSPLFAPEAPPASGKFFFFAVIQMHAPPGQAKGPPHLRNGQVVDSVEIRATCFHFTKSRTPVHKRNIWIPF